jgi:hypothetical protein
VTAHDVDPAYVAGLATQLHDRRPDALDAAEDDLAILRGRLAIVATWINNPAYCPTAREALAQALNLPAPAKETPRGH